MQAGLVLANVGIGKGPTGEAAVCYGFCMLCIEGCLTAVNIWSNTPYHIQIYSLFLKRKEKGNLMETTIINIGGMTCGGCVKSVTKVLEALNGVEKTEVDLVSAKITFDPAEVHIAELVEAIEDAGFDASLSDKA